MFVARAGCIDSIGVTARADGSRKEALPQAYSHGRSSCGELAARSSSLSSQIQLVPFTSCLPKPQLQQVPVGAFPACVLPVPDVSTRVLKRPSRVL